MTHHCYVDFCFRVSLWAIGLASSDAALGVVTQREQLPDSLTIEETLGAAFMGSEDDGMLWNVYRRANPAAAPALRKLLLDPSVVEYHGNVLRLLGYIGGDDDRKAIVAFGDKLTGDLTGWQKASVIAMFDAIGLMARRGDDDALAILKEWSTPGHWKRRRMEWYTRDERAAVEAAAAAGEVPKGAGEALETDLVILRPLCNARAVAGDFTFLDDLRDMARTAKSPAAARFIAQLASREKAFREYARDVKERETAGISASLKRSLATLFNGDLDNPARKDVQRE